MGLVSVEPDPAAGAGEQQRGLAARLRAAIEAKDAEIVALRAALGGIRADLETEHELVRRLELRVAQLERRLRMDSCDSGTPSSKERTGAKEPRRARRQESERERRKDRSRGGQPGHPGKGPAAGPGPGRAEGRGSAGAVPPLHGWPGERGGGGAGLGAGLGRGRRQDGNRVGAARAEVPVLRRSRSATCHDLTALDAIRAGLEGKPWLPPPPVIT